MRSGEKEVGREEEAKVRSIGREGRQRRRGKNDGEEEKEATEEGRNPLCKG